MGDMTYGFLITGLAELGGNLKPDSGSGDLRRGVGDFQQGSGDLRLGVGDFKPGDLTFSGSGLLNPLFANLGIGVNLTGVTVLGVSGRYLTML